MKIRLLGLAALLLTVLANDIFSQGRGGPPRRIDEPETIQLASGGRVEFHSFTPASLGEPVRYSIFLPPGYIGETEKNYPVIYFLHGLNNDDTSWCVDRYGNLPATIEALILEEKVPPFLMVHPQGGNSFYTDSIDGSQKYESYIYEDLRGEIESRFRARKDTRGRAIGGTSMGGYGAVKIALKHPGLYSAVAAGSPIVLLGDDPSAHLTNGSSRAAEFFSRLLGRVFGDPFDQEHWRRNSLEVLAKNNHAGSLRVLLLYGTADRYNNLIPMEDGVRALDRMLRESGVDVTLNVYENESHGWGLISGHIEEIVGFLAKGF